MSKKLYVASLPFSVNTDEELKNIISPMGHVISAKIITDATTGKGKGFGFIEMETEEEASQAISQLNGSNYQGRKIQVSAAKSETNNKNNFTRDEDGE